MKTSAVPNFYKLSANERIDIIGDFCDLTEDERRMIRDLKPEELGPIENVVGYSPKYFLGFINYLKINGKDVFIPISTEEASVIGGACYGAKLCYYSGGIESSVIESKKYPKAIGQVQLIDVKNPKKAKRKILERKNYLLKKAQEKSKHSRVYDLDVEEFECDLGNMLVVNLHIDPGDAMGAGPASRMADYIAPELSKITNAKHNRGIISNYSGRLTQAKLKVPIEDLARKSKITGEKWSGDEVKEKILWLDRHGKKDVKRAVTNNKGIMNCVFGVARSTAQDVRAIGVANAIYAIRTGEYQPLSNWYADDNYLYGELEMLIPCGIRGGEIKNYPKAEFMLKRILKVETADQLAEKMAPAGLVGNLGAMSMISTFGLEEGHQPHRK